MYKKALKEKYRFETVRGLVATEDLWDIPLTARNGFDLNHIAKLIAKEIKDTEETSFVKPVTEKNINLTAKLEIVKDVIADKLKEKEEKELAEVKKARKSRILQIMAEKQDEDLKGKSIEDLQKELESL